MKTYLFDIDGVVCNTIDGDYEHAVPFKDRIRKINKIHADNVVIFWTARGSKTGIDWEPLTKKQFEDWGLEYDLIMFDKPVYDILIDDLSVNDHEFFND